MCIICITVGCFLLYTTRIYRAGQMETYELISERSYAAKQEAGCIRSIEHIILFAAAVAFICEGT